MELIEQFRSFLASNKVSAVTSKNYLSDIRYFLGWFSNTYGEQFKPENLDESVISGYRTQNISKISKSTIERHLSSLRKFSKFLKDNAYINEIPFRNPVSTLSIDELNLKGIREYLHIQGASPSSIKNYMADIKQFISWADKVILPEAEWMVGKNVLSSLDSNLIDEYKKRLTGLNFSPLSINRKLSSLRKLISWAHKEGKISHDFLKTKPEFPYNTRQSFVNLGDNTVGNESEPLLPEERIYSKFGPLRLAQRAIYGLSDLLDFIIIDNLVRGINLINIAKNKNDKDSIFSNKNKNVPRIQDPLKIANISKPFYDPLNVSLSGLPFYKKVIHIVRFNRPKWYLKYHTYPIVHYLHFAILVVFMTVVGSFVYQKMWGLDGSKVLGASTFSPPRVITVKQRLLDSKGNPIASPRDIRFSIYDDPKASGAAQVWEELDRVEPDKNGLFTVILGEKNTISSESFLLYPSLWLGMAIENTAELKPRRQLAQVENASNAQTLQNMGVTSDENYTNSILALDSTGDLSLAGKLSHTFQAVEGQFIISGNVLTLTTIGGSNSNIELVPDGAGIIDIQKPIQNTSNNNNLLSVLGSVEFDDNVSILATSSSQPAFLINQNDIGELISASTGGIAKFTVDNFGNTTVAGDISLSGNNPKILATKLDSNLMVGSSGKGILTLQPTSSGDIEFFSALNTISAQGDLKLTGSILLSTPSATTTFGGIKYTWPTTQTAGSFLKTDGSGALSWALMPDLPTIWSQATGNVGIGTTLPKFRLDVQDSQSASAAAQIFNTNANSNATGVVIKLGNTSSTTNTTNKWLIFDQAGIGPVGMIRGNGTDGVTYQGNGIADFAEYLKKDPNKEIGFGAVVCMSLQGLVYPCGINDETIIGITSKNPTFLGGENLGDGSIAVGLTGQVLTQVSNLHGDIKPGDPLTSSIIPGVAAKATDEGRIVGRAVGSFTSSDCPFDPSQNFGLLEENPQKICKGSIYVILNVSHYEPSLAEKSEKFKKMVIVRTENGMYRVSNDVGLLASKVEVLQDAIVANLTAGVINAQKIVADSIDITGSMKIAGKDLKDYIADTISSKELKSPIASLDEIHTNVISPLANNNLKVKLSADTSLAIENTNGDTVASISSTGDASFSGQLAAENIQAHTLASDTASVSGTLRAGKIIADSIEGFKYEEPNHDYMDIATVSSQFAYVGNLRALTGNFQEGLVVQSPSSFSDISIFGQLKIDGNLTLASNSINAIGTDLELQSLKQGGISLMGGLIYIDIDGNIKVEGNASFAKDVSVEGTLSAGTISPLPGKDVLFNIDKNSFIVRNGTSSSLLTINSQGNLSGSGSATFNKFNLSLVKPAYALSPTESVATGSAGIATILPYQKELTIINSLVTEDSLIYVTPRVDTNNVVLYIVRQVPGVSFTVGINSTLPKNIPFNWIIIN